MKKNVIQINGGITINVDMSVKNVMFVKKNYVWNPATCNCQNGKYLASIMNNSAIMCDEVTDAEAKSNNKETKTVPTNFNEKYNS